MGTTKRNSGSSYEFLSLILTLFKDSLKALNPALEVLMEGASLTGCLWKS